MSAVSAGLRPDARVVIVGASAAGTATASKLRRLGFAGRLTLIGDESPYDRPPLSKQFLAGEWQEDRLALMSQQQLEDLQADLHLGTRAVAMDAVGRTVTDDAGRVHDFDAAVIATGVRARTLPVFSGGNPHVLRTAADAQRLRQSLLAKPRLLVVGGGFLGLETAATAKRLGAEVVVVEPTLYPLSDRLGMKTSSRLLELHTSQGVDLRLGTSVAESSWDPEAGWRVRLTDDSTVLADEVLVAVGSHPQTEWLAGSGLQLDNGVVCDTQCRAAENVWTAGDVARWWDERSQSHVRLEHRTNAIEQADVVARAILDKDAKAYEPVPFFWTDHFDERIQLAGTIAGASSETLMDIDSSKGSTITLFHQGEDLIGVLGWNAPREFQQRRRELLQAKLLRKV